MAWTTLPASENGRALAAQMNEVIDAIRERAAFAYSFYDEYPYDPTASEDLDVILPYAVVGEPLDIDIWNNAALQMDYMCRGVVTGNIPELFVKDTGFTTETIDLYTWSALQTDALGHSLGSPRSQGRRFSADDVNDLRLILNKANHIRTVGGSFTSGYRKFLGVYQPTTDCPNDYTNMWGQVDAQSVSGAGGVSLWSYTAITDGAYCNSRYWANCEKRMGGAELDKWHEFLVSVNGGSTEKYLYMQITDETNNSGGSATQVYEGSSRASYDGDCANSAFDIVGAGRSSSKLWEDVSGNAWPSGATQQWWWSTRMTGPPSHAGIGGWRYGHNWGLPSLVLKPAWTSDG